MVCISSHFPRRWTHHATDLRIRNSKPRILYERWVFRVGVLLCASPALPAVKRRVLRENLVRLKFPLALGFQPLKYEKKTRWWENSGYVTLKIGAEKCAEKFDRLCPSISNNALCCVNTWSTTRSERSCLWRMSMNSRDYKSAKICHYLRLRRGGVAARNEVRFVCSLCSAQVQQKVPGRGRQLL